MGLKALKQALDKREQKKNPTEDLLNMAEFVLKSNFFEFNGNIKQQTSGTAIATKSAPSEFLTNELQISSYELRVTIYCTSYELLFTCELRVTIYCTTKLFTTTKLWHSN